jgi:dipeptidyl aminopeptidase/acylaminoacyl peptidase
MIHVTRNKNIPGLHGKPILLDVFYNKDLPAQPLLIFCHGFKGFKDWGHFNYLAEEFANNGITFLKFNFSYNGTTPDDPLNFGDLEAFGRNNYIIELDDLNQVISWALESEELKPVIDRNRIYLLGHSRGGGIAILKAAEDKRVRKLVTWASVSNFVNRNKKLTVDTWKRDKVIYAHNARTGQDMPMYLQFYEIMMANRARLNILKAARSLKIPFLIIHGTADEAVPFNEATLLHQSAKRSELITIENGNHTFGITHPYNRQGLPDHSLLVIKSTIEFVKKEK